MRALLTLVTVAALATVGCGDDDDEVPVDMRATPDMVTGNDMTAGEDMSTNDDMSTDDDMGTTGPDMVTTDPDMNTSDDQGMGSGADAFCAMFDEVCGYDDTEDNRFDDQEACTGFYNDGSAGCQECITMHLMLAEEMGLNHCPHTMGQGPCSGPCT